MRTTRVLAAVVSSAIVSLLAVASPAQGMGYSHPGVVSANPVDYTPHVKDGTVKAIAVVGSRVYVGGTFTSVVNAGTSSAISRNYLFAFDRATGRVQSFAPALNGTVETIAPAPDGSSIIVGGRFTTVNGVAQRSLAMLRADGTRVDSFGAHTRDGYVTKVLVRGARLIAGGRFSQVRGATTQSWSNRANLAAFNSTTGALDALNIPVTEGRTKGDGTVTSASVLEMDANADGSRLVMLGNFRRVGGQLRQQIAMINLITGAVSGWYTNRYPNDRAGTSQAFQCYDVFDTAMRDVEFSPAGNYFIVVTTGGAGDYNRRSLCDTTARFETPVSDVATSAIETWKNCTGGDTLLSVAVTGAAVYVGGHQRWLDNCGGRDSAVAGSFAADGIGAIDPISGMAIRTWNPGRTRGVGAEELVANAEGLYIGSDTDRLGGEYHARLGLFPLS
jgi:hypothetical protein